MGCQFGGARALKNGNIETLKVSWDLNFLHWGRKIQKYGLVTLHWETKMPLLYGYSLLGLLKQPSWCRAMQELFFWMLSYYCLVFFCLNTFCIKRTLCLLHGEGFSSTVCRCWRCFLPMEAAHQALPQQRGEEWPWTSPCLPSHRPHISTELLTGKSKGYCTTDYKDLKPEQMSGCLTAKYSPLAQPPVLPSIFLIRRDHRLQPHLIPFPCVSFL